MFQSPGDIRGRGDLRGTIERHIRDLQQFLRGQGQWKTWTPAYTNFTLGAGVEVARFVQVGDWVHFVFHVSLAADSAVTGSVQVSLPVEARSAPTQLVIGSGSLVDDSGGFTHVGYARQESTTTMLVVQHAQATARHAGLSSTSPFTWATNDRIILTGTYEAA